MPRRLPLVLLVAALVAATFGVVPAASGAAGGPAAAQVAQVTEAQVTGAQEAQGDVRPLEDVYAFGDAPYLGSTGRLRLKSPIVGMAATPSGQGYWLVAADGGIFAYGDAEFFGSTGALQLVSPIVGMASTPTGRGYWLTAADGGIFAYGDAEFFGSVPAALGGPPDRPIVDIAPTASGRGYWLVAGDGGLFAFGDAGFFGSVRGALGGGFPDQPIVAMASSPSGDGYWMTAADGGIFAFGDAPFHGSVRGALNGGFPDEPVVGMSPTADGSGYTLFARDGGAFAFGRAGFFGSAKNRIPTKEVVGAVPTPTGGGYWLVGRDKPRQPLTGQFVSSDVHQTRPALAIKIGNGPQAGQQFGLAQADLVFEQIVEGDITRFVAVYQSQDSGNIGPVRSARSTDTPIMQWLNWPLFGYSGSNAVIDRIVRNTPTVALPASAVGGYVRVRGRRAPFNLFTSTQALYAQDPGAPSAPQVFQYRKPEEGLAPGASPAQGIDVTVGNNLVQWRWDAGQGRWLRWQRGAPHRDEAGNQLGARNVVVQFVDYIPGVVRASPEAVAAGAGPAWVLVDGHVIGATWSRPTVDQPLRFLDSEGNDISLDAGTTWIEMPRPGTGVVVP